MSQKKNSKKNERNFTYVDEKKEEFKQLYPDFKEFITRKLESMSYYSQQTYLNAINRFYTLTNKLNAKEITKDDILTFLDNDEFKELSNRSKNHYNTIIKKYLKFFEREDLLNLFPRYREKNKELNKTDLITREELDFLLKNVNTQKKAMIMVNYEGALRRGELVSILFKNIQFREGFVDLYIGNSKTILRNIPLIESAPYLREYFSENKFEQKDRIFPFSEHWITSYYNKLSKRLKKKYPKKWKKHLHPHILRHSRLTELALTKLNEPQLRKFAGWTKDSQMSAVYFHLDDTDIKNILVEQNGQKPIKKKETKTFKPIKCKVCNTINPRQNAFCYKCGNVINEERVVIERVKEQVDIEQLKKENIELSQKIDKLEDFYEKTNKILPDLLEMYDFFDEQIKRTPTPIQKQISNKEIIETLGLKESPKKSGEKVEISPEVKKKI